VGFSEGFPRPEISGLGAGEALTGKLQAGRSGTGQPFAFIDPMTRSHRINSNACCIFTDRMTRSHPISSSFKAKPAAARQLCTYPKEQGHKPKEEAGRNFHKISLFYKLLAAKVCFRP
jgi:hypothetical protein